MPDTPDMDLVREFARHNSEAAFTELVRRHISLVYSVARRCTGNDGDAQDVTQAVFIILARKAAGLRERTLLPGWLYETTRFTAARLLRTNARRQQREQEAYMQSTLNEAETADIWEKLSPHLEAAMSNLAERDRALLVLRFYQNKSGPEAAALMGIREGAAHMRVTRAIEKLRKLFAQRGVTLSGEAIAGTISANSVQAAPAALVKTISAVAFAKGATASTSTLTLIKGALKIMAWTKAKAAIVSVVIVGMATYSVIQHQAQSKLRQQNESSQQQITQLQTENKQPKTEQVAPTPHLPAPQMQMTTSVATLPAEDLPTTNLYARLKDKNPKLTPEQVEAFLKANGRSAANLLAAFRTSGDPALLKEAMGKYPNDPQVAFEATFDKDLSPAEQRQWLNTFEQSAPNNALANYFSALNYFNAGQIDQGVQELTAASGKQFNDYTLSRYQDDEEAFLAAGYTEADAKALSSTQLLLPQLAQMNQLSSDMIDLANAYRQAGDTTSEQSVLQMAANMGQNYANPSAGESMVSQLFGIAIERNILGAMDPSSPYGNNGQTVQDQVNQLTQQNAALRQLIQQFYPLQQTMSDQDWIIYKDRWMAFGEASAEEWVVNKYGQQ